MTEKEFLNQASNSKRDVLQSFLDILHGQGIEYCVIGGLAVNAYVEPVVSLDLDLVVAAADIGELLEKAGDLFKIKKFEHSLNLKSDETDLRIQLQTNPVYQDFIRNASATKVMGYRMKVAALEDVLQGKIWAFTDQQRRQSKKQKDLADILRIVESFPHLKGQLPDSIKSLT
ncbi:hypothetical protein MJD09_22980 [bacterium]|nr:hypothetical protein [bacterium]